MQKWLYISLLKARCIVPRQIAEVFASCVEMTINANQVKYGFLTQIFFLTEGDSTLTKIRGKESEIRESQVSIYQM